MVHSEQQKTWNEQWILITQTHIHAHAHVSTVTNRNATSVEIVHEAHHLVFENPRVLKQV